MKGPSQFLGRSGSPGKAHERGVGAAAGFHRAKLRLHGFGPTTLDRLKESGTPCFWIDFLEDSAACCAIRADKTWWNMRFSLDLSL